MSASRTRPGPARRAGRWIAALVIVAALAAAAWFAAEAVARDVVTGIVQDRVRSELSLPAEQRIDVEIAGAVLPQLIAGSFERMTVSSQDVQVDRLRGDMTVVAQGVPARSDGSLKEATATVEVDADQLGALLSAVEGFPAADVGVVAPDVTMQTELRVFGAPVPVGVALTPSAVDGDIVLTPASLEVAGAEVSAEALRGQFGLVAELALKDWTVCIAQYLPAGISLTSVEVADRGEQDELVATFAVQGGILTDPALLADGTCA